MDVTVVIPVYNSSEGLLTLGESLLNVLSSIQLHFEIIMVDDGSQDSSFQVLQDLHRKYNCVKAVRLKRNLGQHGAILLGLQHALGEYILMMDDDMAYAVKAFPLLWEKAVEGFDVVSGRRVYRFKRAPGRAMIAKGFNLGIGAMARQRFHDATSPFKLFKRELIHDLVQRDLRVPLLVPEYVMMKGKRIAELLLPDDHQETTLSRYTFSKLAEHTLILLSTFFYMIIPSHTQGFFRSSCLRNRNTIEAAIGFEP